MSKLELGKKRKAKHNKIARVVSCQFCGQGKYLILNDYIDKLKAHKRSFAYSGPQTASNP